MSTTRPNRTNRSGLTRRAAITRLAGGGAGLALAAPTIAASAQEATPPTIAAAPAVVEEYIAALEAFEFERIGDMLAEEAVFEQVPTDLTLQGQDAIRGYFEEVQAALSDPSFHYTSLFGADAWASGEWVLSATYTGNVPEFPPGEGQDFTIRGVDVFEVADGQIQRHRRYFDVYSLLNQFGVLPGMEELGGAATPGATPEAKVVQVELTEFEIRMPNELPAGSTTFEVTNIGAIEHNFEVEGQGIEREFEENLQPGESGTLQVDLEAGTYEVYCPVGDHAEQGMRLELTVTE